MKLGKRLLALEARVSAASHAATCSTCGEAFSNVLHWDLGLPKCLECGSHLLFPSPRRPPLPLSDRIACAECERCGRAEVTTIYFGWPVVCAPCLDDEIRERATH